MLRSCQTQRPNENISEWVLFFFDALKNIQEQLTQKLHIQQTDDEQLLPREKLLLSFIQNHPGCKSGDITKKTGLSRMIVIRLLSTLIARDLIEKHGSGTGTQYTIR